MLKACDAGVLSVSVVFQEGKRQGCDERLVAGAHPGDPLAVGAQLDGSGLEAVGVARDGVTHPQLDLPLADERRLGVRLADEAEYPLEALAGVRDEVLIADAEVPLGGAAPEGFGGGVPGVPEGRALGRAEADHVLPGVGVRLELLPRPG